MQLHRLTAAVAAVLLTTAGAAVAAPGNANSAQADGHAAANASASTAASTAAGTPTHGTDDGSGTLNGTDGDAVVSVSVRADGDGTTASGEAGAAAGERGDERGPGTGAPDDVPSHIERIRGLVGEHVAGALSGSLGEAIGGLFGSSGADEAENATDDERGPTDVPGTVPSHVERIHDLISEHVNGVLSGETEARGGADVSGDATATRG